ncbi:Hsp70 family protein [Oceanobacillus bengalensis]|uniref:Chaperone protein DnaK n=1 Tax=Oceanobacillus bengalensis TaxID=1435466 RepID=A0A494YSV0_9BACI|nr:Hsp70 family protein [Oceanobacillus bengalensis]RKQ13208.1 Hsp70 family protein [Oceanobacillus bengalensis]
MKVGIDLGTTNSAVAYINANGRPEIIPNNEGERTTPSVILIENGKAIVGSVAKEAATSQIEDTIQFVKRQIGNKSFKFPISGSDHFIDAVEASAIILKKVVKDAEEALGEKITDVVITVPAYFDDAKRNATKEAGEMIGVNVLKVINEPTAAALAYYDIEKANVEQNIAIYDLGGGTFDVTIVNIHNEEIKVLATDGDSNLGGFDFDNAIFNYVADNFEKETGLDIYDDENGLQELRENAEKCKKSLTKRNKYNVPLTSQGQTVHTEITRELFNQLIESYIKRTQQIMKETINEAGLTWNDIHKVLLVGGSTRTPIISSMINNFTGIVPSKELNPDEVVALGAAVQAAFIKTDNDTSNSENIIVRDVNSHSLGVISNHGRDTMMNSIILKRNSEIPCEMSREFYTMHENQKEIMLEITEGEDEDPNYVTIIGNTTISLPEKLPIDSPIEIKISYDQNGIVHVKAKDSYHHVELGEFTIERQSNLTKQEFQQKQQELLSLEVE